MMANSWKDNYARYKDFFLNILRVYYAKPNIKIYLELILSLTTIVIFSIFAIKPTVLTIIELNKEIQAKEETVRKINQKLDALKAYYLQEKEKPILKESMDSLSIVGEGKITDFLFKEPVEHL